MKVLHDAYKAFFDFRATDWTITWTEDWRKLFMGLLGPSNHDVVLLNELEGDGKKLPTCRTHTTPALPFPPLPPMYIPRRSPAKNCSHCGTHMHTTEECMSHAVLIVHRASQKVEAKGFRFLTPSVYRYETRQRPHAGPGWSHVVPIGFNNCGTLHFEKGIANRPNPTCVEDSGTFCLISQILTY